MLDLLSYKSLGQMQQSRELLQQSLAAVPLRSPFRIYVEKSVAYLETMILHCRSIRLAAQSPDTLMAVNFSPTTIVGRPRNRQRVANGTQPALRSWSRPMSQLGQTEKHSARADVFRSSPNNGH